MSRLEALLTCFLVLGLLAGCDELGNPKQLTTGPTTWIAGGQELVTTTRSFRNPRTIRRLVANGLDDLDYADPSIGPDETLTFVTVAPRRLRPIRPGALRLITQFEMQGRRPITREWSASQGSRLWGAAFSLPGAPTDAITTAVP